MLAKNAENLVFRDFRQLMRDEFPVIVANIATIFGFLFEFSSVTKCLKQQS
jgi:hypothetical protein